MGALQDVRNSVLATNGESDPVTFWLVVGGVVIGWWLIRRWHRGYHAHVWSKRYDAAAREFKRAAKTRFGTSQAAEAFSTSVFMAEIEGAAIAFQNPMKRAESAVIRIEGLTAAIRQGRLDAKWHELADVDAPNRSAREDGPSIADAGAQDLSNTVVPPEIADALGTLDAGLEEIAAACPESASECYDLTVSQIETLERTVRGRYGGGEKPERYLRYLVNSCRHLARTFVESHRPQRSEEAYPFLQSMIFRTWVDRLGAGAYDRAFENGAAFDGIGDSEAWKISEYSVDERDLL